MHYRIGHGIRLGNVSSSPFRAIELRERTSGVFCCRIAKPRGASAGKPGLLAFTSSPALCSSHTRRFSACPRPPRETPRRASENETLAARLKGTITSPNVARYARHERGYVTRNHNESSRPSLSRRNGYRENSANASRVSAF